MRYSRMTAQEVGEILLFFKDERPGKYAGFEAVFIERGEIVPTADLNIRVNLEMGKTIDEGSEVIHCLDEKGRAVDVVLGTPAERKENLARFIIQEGASET